MAKMKAMRDFEKMSKVIGARTHAAFTKMLQDLADGAPLKPGSRGAMRNFMDLLSGAKIHVEFEAYRGKAAAIATYRSRITIPETVKRVRVEVIVDGSARTLAW